MIIKPIALRFLIAFCILSCTLSSHVHGDVVAFDITAVVRSDVEAFSSVTAASTLPANNMFVTNGGTGNGSTANSITESTLNYSWNGSTLSGLGLISQEKTKNAKPGGVHYGESILDFDFTVDALTYFSFSGTYGYSSVTGGDDTVGWLFENLTLGTNQSGSASETNSGVNGQSFSNSGVLAPGDYSFTITANFTETINNLEVREAGWNLSGLSLTAVPEPSGLAIAAMIVLGLGCRRRRSRLSI